VIASLSLPATAAAATYEGTEPNGQVGAPGGDFGTAYLFSGSAAGPSLTWSWSATGSWTACQHTSALFGGSVAGIGDIDGDGFPDFAIGEPGYDDCTLSPDDWGPRGAVFFYRGSAGGPIAAGAVYGSWHGEGLGSGVAGAGDVNGDG